VRVLLENERVRGAEDVEGWPVRRWEEAALDLASRSLKTAEPSGNGDQPPGGSAAAAVDSPAPGASAQATSRILVLGGGMFTLARQMLERHEEVRVDVTERNPAILAAGEEHFALPSDHPRLRVVSRDPLAALDSLSGPYRVTLVDGTGLPFGDPVPLPGASWLEGLRDLTAEGGIVILGGIERGLATGLPLERLLSEGGSLFPSVALYTARTEPGPVNRPVPGEAATRSGELLLVFSPDANADFPGELKGLTLEAVQRTAASDPLDIGTLR
jgi:hypothetical protein